MEINEIIKEYNDTRQQRGIPRLPIHVDAAYGGFVLRFTRPDFEWDFRASEVMSINVSNHKFGLVYPGLGTVIFRNKKVVPKSLFTKLNYLGKEINDYAINFSRSSSQVICQYYNFLRLGENGYTKIMQDIIDNAGALANSLLKLEFEDDYHIKHKCFELFTSHEKIGNSIEVYLPNIVVKLNEKAPFSASQLSDMLKLDGWSVPAYTLPEKLTNIHVLRMVVKENFSRDMLELFINSMRHAIDKLTEPCVVDSNLRSLKGHQVIC